MYLRIVSGRAAPGQWDAFEAAFTAAMTARGDVKGLKDHWLVHDQIDPDAG